MNKTKKRKEVQKALILALCPGLGFLYLEKIVYWMVFAVICFLPLCLMPTTGSSALMIFTLLYGLSIYYTYVLCSETLRSNEVYKKDPYYMLCMSTLFDGLGQLLLKQNKKAYIMMTMGLTPCIITWVVLSMKYGFMDMVLAGKGHSLYTITNFMLIWLIVAIPTKILSMIDAYYSTYHLYIAKK